MCPYKKIRHRHAEEGPSEDTGRRQPSAHPGEGPQKEPALPTP